MTQETTAPDESGPRWMHRHTRFFVAVVCAVLSAIVALFVLPDLAVQIGVVVLFAVYLVLIAFRIQKLTPDYLKDHADGTDEPAFIIFGVTVAAAMVALVSLFGAMNDKSAYSKGQLGLAFASVVLGWFTTHTMAAMHYAHRYWSPDMQEVPEDTSNHGLDFPQTEEPGVWEFLYFSFVIGMTAQTSDVDITSTGMRRINLAHSIVSFFFNTVLVAAAVNAAVSLA